MRDHIKSALFLVQKSLQMKNVSFAETYIDNPEQLLTSLSNLALIKNDYELNINVLRSILALLEKFEKQSKTIPIEPIRNSKLMANILEYLSVERHVGPGIECTKWCLSVLIQISYQAPKEFSSVHIERSFDICHLQPASNNSLSEVESKALIKIQEQAIKLLCNLLTQAESCSKVIDPSQQGVKAIFNCLNQRHRNTVKFALGALLNYTQVFQKSEQGKLYSPFHAFGLNGGIQHLMAAMNTALDLLDYESMLYSAKLVSNLSLSAELVLVMGETQVADYLCRMIQRLKDGPKNG